MEKAANSCFGLLRSLHLVSGETTFGPASGDLTDWMSIGREHMCKTRNYTRVKCAKHHFRHASHLSSSSQRLHMLERQCIEMHGIPEACGLPICAPCREARYMHLHLAFA